MRSIIIAVLFTALIVGCDQSAEQDNPSLEICTPDKVQMLQMRVLYGRATVKVLQVRYDGYGAFSTPLEFDVGDGDIVGIPFCYGKGDIEFQIEVVPTGPSRNPSFENEVELGFGPHQWADLEISWGGSLQDTGPSVGVQSLTNNGEAENFVVGVRWSQF